MREIKAILTERITRTPTIESFRFKTKEEIDFIPGQFLQVILDEENRQNKDLNKYLSFSSSPTRDYLEFSKRLSQSEFSQRLRKLEVNDEVLLKAPLGNCVFEDNQRKISFLIGGIGITPVVSIIEYIMEKKLDTDIFLVYSNRTEEEIAFKQELDYWQSVNKNLKIIYTVSECEPKDKTCIFGVINQELLTKRVCDLNERIVFIFGPPKMVETMVDLATQIGCSKDNIKIENFIGY
jgi:ferredoxin-NADP reductase